MSIRLVAGFARARRLASSDDRRIRDVSAYFAGCTRANETDLERLVRSGMPPIVAAVELGWVPRFATVEQQAFEEQALRDSRRVA